MTAMLVGRIASLIILILSLTANQLARTKQSVQKYGAFYVFHSDEMAQHDIK